MSIKIKKLIQEAKPSILLDLLSDKVNLLKDGHLDSLEMVELIHLLEVRHGFNIDEYEKKFTSFTISNIESFLNENFQ